MADILNITGEPIFDDRIVKIETHTYNPYANNTFEHSDKIRIPIQQQDLYTLPSNSFFYFEGKLTFALQTGRKNVMSQDIRVFDDCNLSNVKVYLNSEFYSYDDLNLDFSKEIYAVLFDMYAHFREAYYGIDFETMLNMFSFVEKGPFAVIDCSRNESVRSTTVKVRIEFDCKENVPANTTAYCLIIHDRVIEYCPLST
ncbi:hypothetical protein ALC57_13828 [Trachymyrmex cornetzi]|uniref:Double jelly roll-like domain-containing protein n=1 Tax=Trachymyrmex cornetzi TaxID=471704 RepID=A0A151IZ32_9HYME|nr:hypothetical protein ALC57_13828 [Trachymyrmex cornetzi]